MRELAELGRAFGMKDTALGEYFRQHYVQTFAGRGGITRAAAEDLARSDFKELNK